MEKIKVSKVAVICPNEMVKLYVNGERNKKLPTVFFTSIQDLKECGYQVEDER
jgi:hypothetical protein